MAPRKPNYSFERHERDRAKAAKIAEKAEAKREQRERDRAAADGPADDAPAAPDPDQV
ncbi:MAG TPA: hypothetical protein VN814_01810 [Caulobacteraceae bacterium]|nr:hypothetical protein [Caulobacteraceae bacterium]